MAGPPRSHRADSLPVLAKNARALTPAMRNTLTQAAQTGELRRTHTHQEGRDPWPAHPVTLHALTRRGYLTAGTRRNRKAQVMQTWTLTPAGRVALEPTIIHRVDRPLYLAHIVGSQGDYTPLPARASDDLEVIDTGRLNTRWSRSARQRHAAARGNGNRQPGKKPVRRRPARTEVEYLTGLTVVELDAIQRALKADALSRMGRAA